MSHAQNVRVALELEGDFRFRVDFGQPGVPPLVMDEPEPLGDGLGPNAARVLAAAVGDCLSASALFCLHRAHIEVEAMHTTVDATLERNEAGRVRIRRIAVRIEPVVPIEQHARMRRCMEIYEDFCIVTQSVRQGIDVDAEVVPQAAPQAA